MPSADNRNDPDPEDLVVHVIDEQTGRRFPLQAETPLAIVAASCSAIYLLAIIPLLVWLSIVMLTSTNTSIDVSFIGINPIDISRYPGPQANSIRLFELVAVAGALGGAVDGLRSILVWHAERRSYGVRFIWKYLSRPFLGAALGLIAFALAKGGASAVSGELAPSSENPSTVGSGPMLLAFAVSALAGFSAEHVFRWFDAQANALFRATEKKLSIAPDLTGKTTSQARELLRTRHLVLGETRGQVDNHNVDRIITQLPAPGSVMSGGGSVDVTVGTRASSTLTVANKGAV